ncbi:hypothetical protein Tco_0613982 [Tanacetum coccineum]
MVFHNEDGNPARANIKQALGYLKDGDGDGNSHAQDGDPIHDNSEKQDKKRLCTKQNASTASHIQQTGVGGGIEEKIYFVNERRQVLVVVEEEGDSWMTPIHEYLTDETLLAKRKKARAIKRKSQSFAIINEILYKKSFLGPWLRCVGPSQANYVLREIHEGSCSMHAGTRSHCPKLYGTVINGDNAQGRKALIKHDSRSRRVAKNDEALEINLELLEENERQSDKRRKKQEANWEKFYNTKVECSFKIQARRLRIS